MPSLISVVVPVYNSAPYLETCLRSLLAQTWQDWEAILVDDGSTDGSARLCDTWAKKEPRLRVIHQENAGVSAARNAGIAAARGDYLAFVDADDWVEPDYLQTLFINIGGSAGEISAIAILAGFIYLLARKVIRPYITLSILATVFVFSGIFWLVNPDQYTDPLFNLLTGGVLLGSVFMATDYVTSPMSDKGGIIYGIGIGLLTILIRYFGSYPEGMSFAILIMNSVVPLINKFCKQKKYGR